jgi:hypothetical protein
MMSEFIIRCKRLLALVARKWTKMAVTRFVTFQRSMVPKLLRAETASERPLIKVNSSVIHKIGQCSQFFLAHVTLVGRSLLSTLVPRTVILPVLAKMTFGSEIGIAVLTDEGF